MGGANLSQPDCISHLIASLELHIDTHKKTVIEETPTDKFAEITNIPTVVRTATWCGTLEVLNHSLTWVLRIPWMLTSSKLPANSRYGSCLTVIGA